MADIGDRGRRRRRRGGRREQYDGVKESPPVPARPPIILAKPPSERNLQGSFDMPALNLPSSKTLDKTVVMLKAREERPASLGNLAAMIEGSPSQPVYQLHRSIPTGSPNVPDGGGLTKLGPAPEMLQSVRMVDDTMQWCDGVIETLLDQTDFFTVGILGPQGAGKSTILSLLAGNQPSDPSNSFVFRPQTKECCEVGVHQTSGIDIFVTSERLILLDSQPIPSASVLDNMIHHDKKYPVEYTMAENCLEMQALQLATFLLTVCNVVIVEMDWFIDLNLLRFLQTAEMLKPPTPSSGHESGLIDDSPEYYPHVVFVLNKAKMSDFSAEKRQDIQKTLSLIMAHSKLKWRGSVSLVDDSIPCLSTMTPDVNLFLLPSMDEENKCDQDAVLSLLPEYRGYPSFEQMLRMFSQQILSMPRYPLTHTLLSEKNWFHYAARTWEAVKKSTLLSEYNRLLP